MGMAEQSTRNTNEVFLIMDYASEIKSRLTTKEPAAEICG